MLMLSSRCYGYEVCTVRAPPVVLMVHGISKGFVLHSKSKVCVCFLGTALLIFSRQVVCRNVMAGLGKAAICCQLFTSQADRALLSTDHSIDRLVSTDHDLDNLFSTNHDLVILVSADHDLDHFWSRQVKIYRSCSLDTL